jgi:hypothetical protein
LDVSASVLPLEMRELVASGDIPLPQLTGSRRFANARLNDALAHAGFDYIESRGSTSIRRFLEALIVPPRWTGLTTRFSICRRRNST